MHHYTNRRATLALNKVEMEEAGVGDIVCLSGVPEVTIGDTLCDTTEYRHASPALS